MRPLQETQTASGLPKKSLEERAWIWQVRQPFRRCWGSPVSALHSLPPRANRMLRSLLAAVLNRLQLSPCPATVFKVMLGSLAYPQPPPQHLQHPPPLPPYDPLSPTTTITTTTIVAALVALLIALQILLAPLPAPTAPPLP